MPSFATLPLPVFSLSIFRPRSDAPHAAGESRSRSLRRAGDAGSCRAHQTSSSGSCCLGKVADPIRCRLGHVGDARFHPLRHFGDESAVLHELGRLAKRRPPHLLAHGFCLGKQIVARDDSDAKYQVGTNKPVGCPAQEQTGRLCAGT